MNMFTTVKTVDPVEIQKLLATGYPLEIVDVRTPAEFREVHAVGAKNIPLDELDPQYFALKRHAEGEPVYFICRSDSRGKKACEACISGGYSNVVNIAGGTVAWEDLGLPVVRGKKTMSLERQVRVVAGTLVLVGVILAWTLQQPLWTGLSAFVGAGLVYAGLTDTCGMAMLLAKMPWNRVKLTPDKKTTSEPSCST